MRPKTISYFMILLVVFGSFAPFAVAEFNNPTTAGFAGNYNSITNTYQSSRPTRSSFYKGSFDNYWPILTNLKDDNCNAISSDFIIGIPPGGCSPAVVRSDLLAEQNVPVFCQLSAIRVNPLIDVSTIKSISFKGDYPKEVAGISFHPARAAVKSYNTLLGSPIDENIGYVVIVLKKHPDERNLEEYVSGMLTATIRYDAKGAFGTGAAEYYLEPMGDEEWKTKAVSNSFWAGKGYLRVKNIDDNEATIDVMTSKDDIYRTVTLKEGDTSNRIYYPGQYCTAAMKLKLNKIDNSADMAKVNIEGDTFWIRKNSRLLGGKCVVRDLNVFPGGTGSIEISCSGNSRFNLVLGNKGVVLNNGTNVSVGIGGSIKKGDNDYYLGYYGKSDAVGGNFVILFDRKLTEDDVSLITGIFDVESFEKEKEMQASLDGISKFEGHYKIIKEGESGYGVRVVSVGVDSDEEGYPEGSSIPKYLNLANDAVSDLIDTFPSEKTENKVYFGEEALKKQIELARKAKDEGMQADLIKKFLDTYPESDSVEYMRDIKLNLERFNHAGSSANVLVNNENYNIRVDGFAIGSGASDSVTVRFAGGTSHGNLKRGKVYNVGNNFEEILDVEKQKSIVPRLTIVDIDGASAKLHYVWKDSESGNTRRDSVTIKVGEYANLGDERVRVDGVNVREVAYVSLIPEVRNKKTEANFTFNIGIEKRAIELNPEKARDKVARLNKSIADWETRLDKLGKLIKGMKGACFATSTVLTLKSFISGFSGGGSFARKKVMSFYEEKCRSDHPGMDLQVCYSTYFKDDIEKTIEAYGDGVSYVNKKVKECTSESESISKGFFSSKVVDSGAYIKELNSCGLVSDVWKYTIDDTKITRADLDDARDFQAVILKEKVCKGSPDSVACNIATKEMEGALEDNVDGIEAKKMSEKSKEDLGVSVNFVNSNPYAISVYTVTAVKKLKDIGVGSNVAGVKYGGKNYYVVVGDKGLVKSVYDIKGKNVKNDNNLFGKINNAFNFVVPLGKDDSCSNPINNPHVSYYESGNKQGFVGIVPIDKREGWYAQIENDDYDASGVARAFSICNVGSDMQMGEGARSGDLCQLFQISSAGSVSDFIPCPKMTPSEVKRLYQKAESKIREANKNGNGVDLNGEFVYSTLPLGPSSTGLECTDFMSVDDCNLMFNVCDPVICPTSRCDLDGAFPVRDVIASGIVGSIALCLPNFGDPTKGGVLIPVCLSGIHAGLDAYVSILKSYKQCLEENIESGSYTGICDEITAVYTCEFFWGQLSPILDNLLVRFVNGLYGGFQTRGGAEYLTIQKSFENLDNSIKYFSDNYMANSVKSFRLKNTEEIGGTVCKGFVGSSFPTSADAFNSLLEPESPFQFYAHFSENLFSDATVPSTSYYKVYYHIYAGKDHGVQYKVYLKSPPTSSYYSVRQTLLVDSGYAAKGVADDKTVDFTAPSGYKELCVNINGRDECGFGSVTSDFGLNYASQAYINDQADNRQITSTKDCVTTSTSAWALASPNLQAGVEKSLGQDDIATSGIIRICASTNPNEGVVGGNDVYCDTKKLLDGKNLRCAVGYSCVGVDGDDGSSIGVCKNTNTNQKQVSQGKWVDVGYCDKEDMRCWLDSTSVKENLGQYMAVNNLTISELVRDSEDLTELKEQYKNVAEKLSVLGDKIEGLTKPGVVLLNDKGSLAEDVQDIIDGLDEINGVDDNNIGQGSNSAKAQALAMKASVYRLIVEKLLEKSENKNVEIIGKTSVSKIISDNIKKSVVSGGNKDEEGKQDIVNTEDYKDFELKKGDIYCRGLDTNLYIKDKKGGSKFIYLRRFLLGYDIGAVDLLIGEITSKGDIKFPYLDPDVEPEVNKVLSENLRRELTEDYVYREDKFVKKK